jgi:phosphatidylserine decarboxylase
VTSLPQAVDVRRRAGWLPDDQEDLEAWLDGHQQRVETRGEQIVLDPVIGEFQELIDRDPVVRMYVNQMIAQVPATKPYRRRHLESVDHLLRLINEVLTMAPEFGPAMVATPLGAILDWTMGTAAGFAAYRDPRINAMLKKIVAVWCEFLSGGDSLYGLNGSPSGGKSAEAELGRGQSCGPSDPHGKRKRRSRRLETALNKRHRGLKRRKPKNDLSPNAAASERRRPTRRGSRFTGRRGSVRPGRAGRR